jgi:hypothetical protein
MENLYFLEIILLKAYFENIQSNILRFLSKATHEIIIVVAWINTDIFKDTLVELLKKNVKITIVYNNDFINRKIVKDIKGIEYISIKMPIVKNKMHNKFCIIDNRYVISGSYNWSENAEKNLENIIITDDLHIVYQFKIEYNKFIHLNELYNDARNIPGCKECKGRLITLAVLENVDYYNCVDSLRLYSVCSEDESHNNFIGEVYFNNISNTLESDVRELDANECVSEEVTSIINAYEMEIFTFNALNHIRKHNKYDTFFHAIAVDKITNFMEYTQGYEGAENYELVVIWKNRFLSDIIKDRYYFLN